MEFTRSPVFIVLALAITAFLSPVLSRAGETVCTFSAVEHGQDYSFNITSRPDGECTKQALTISVQHNARLVAQLEKQTDKLAESAWVSDLDEDGRPELILVSHPLLNPAAKILIVYSLDGAGLKETLLPEAPDREGYRGGDQFSREPGKIVRSYMLYRTGDRDGVPSGGKRIISYMYRDRLLLPAVQNETVVKSPAPVRKAKTGTVGGGPAIKITAIAVKTDYLEIHADGPIENYKVTRIADPWRLIIDIPGARSALAVNTVAINSLGISNARIGSNKGRLRIVLDSTEGSLPTETVTQAEHALRIGFYRADR
jgi:hypothetical protein